jgi:hypothetical protein
MTMPAKPTRWGDCVQGRSHHRAACPFCNQMMTIYIWSLRGGGKRCTNADCKAMLGSTGTAFKLCYAAANGHR